MKAMVAGVGSVIAMVSAAGPTLAQEQLPAAPPPAAAPAQGQPAAPAPPSYGEPDQAAPPESQWVYSYPTGQWVYTSEYGWIWVPNGAAPSAVDGVPYTYLYTPTYGWTWYVSPWGWGGYHYGPWVTHPWRPFGWRGGWVAHPHVVGRMGPAPYYGGGHYPYGGGHYYGHRR